MSSGTVRTEVTDDGIGWLIYDNPSRHNAVTATMLRELPGAVDQLVADDRVRVVVIRGAGQRSFISGADIGGLPDRRPREHDGPGDGDASRTPDDEAFGIRELLAIDKPLIAMIHGWCIGGGLIVALCADMRFASHDAVFQVPVGRLGVTYPLRAVELLRHLVGPSAAADLMMTARRIVAEEAHQLGLVDRVVDTEALADTVVGVARQIGENAPLSVRGAKLALRLAGQAASERDLDAWHDAVRRCWASDDFAEGKRAFAERRPPRFTGR